MEKNSVLVKDLLQDLQRVAQIRKQLAELIDNMATIIDEAEEKGDAGSGKLSLAAESEDLHRVSISLRQGVFRILFLGDLKRGKSTVLNALIGERVLPANVTRCTAILTVIQYGVEKTVTVHFTDGKEPEKLSLDEFYERYTIQPDEAERLDSEDKKAFPNVSHAVITYPLALLEKGIELVDSPGLNDTEERNEISLGFIRQSHAVVFVMNAVQAIAETERRYLDNYIKDRNIPIFFILNRWDSIRESLIDPDDEDDLRQKEAAVLREFKTRLSPYCQIDGEDLTDKRIFPLSALNALRQQLKGFLDDRKFLKMSESLNGFLAKNRAVTEFKRAERVSRQSYRRVHDVINQRTSLLGLGADELRASIQEAKPEFEKFYALRENLRNDIRRIGDINAVEIANEFRTHILNLSSTFEEDFVRYQPKLDFVKFLQKSKREEFEKELRQAFGNYINDQIAICDLASEKRLRKAFVELNRKADQYGRVFDEIVDRVNTKVGDHYHSESSEGSSALDTGPRWAAIMAGLGSVIMGDWIGGGMALGGGTFGWKTIMTNMGVVLGAAIAVYLAAGVILGPITVMLIAMGAGAWQAEMIRKKLIGALKEGLAKELPSIADSMYRSVFQKVKKTFDDYETVVIEQLDKDIQDRKQTLDNLLAKLEDANFNREAEERRLKRFQTDTFHCLQMIEDTVSEMIPIK